MQTADAGLSSAAYLLVQRPYPLAKPLGGYPELEPHSGRLFESMTWSDYEPAKRALTQHASGAENHRHAAIRVHVPGGCGCLQLAGSAGGAGVRTRGRRFSWATSRLSPFTGGIESYLN